ncbi:MAG: septum formation initiator family protein [Pseudomonadota bacterium]
MLRSLTRNWQAKSGQIAVLLICLGLFAYFAFHIRHGRHGWEAQSRLMAHSTLLEFEIRSLQAVSDRLHKDVKALQHNPPHPDIVEEFGRRTLGFARPGEQLYRVVQ